MELWTEYEGRTIDGTFPLTKLIRPEGRSAFFSTSNGVGGPTVIRLIESHFDDEEILVRWRGIQALNHPNLVKLIQFGQVTLDDTSLVYAVMESVDANLAEILSERRLTVLETKQVAASMLSALQALHSNGFVHEHIEPANVLAVGEAIKLRSDCIRETPEGQDGGELKNRDVRAFASVLLQALTQRNTLEGAARDLPLDASFDAIVRKGTSGEWGLTEIAAALGPAAETKPVAPAARPTAPVARPVTGTPSVARPVVAESPKEAAPVVPPLSTARIRVPVDEEPRGIEGRRLAIGLGAMLLLLLVAFFVHGRSSKTNKVVQETAAPAATAPGSDAAAGQSPATPTADANSAAPTATTASAPAQQEQPQQTDTRGQWRVVAFTYNREAQAQQKAASVAEKHPDLRPEVFTPNGHGPYLVTVGGPMSREDAFALVKKGRGEGLPRDSYAQNYRR